MSSRSLVTNKHVPYLVVGIAVPILAALLVVVDDERIAFRFLPDVLLPQTCISRTVFSFNCPACGLTRSIIYFVHGRFAESLAMHRLGWFVLLLIIAQVPYRLWCLTGRHPQFLASKSTTSYCWVALLVLLLLNRAWDFVAFF